MLQTIEFIVPGEPIGKGRARAGVLMRGGAPVIGAGGRPIVTHHTPEKTASYEGLIAHVGRQAMNGKPLLLGACVITLDICRSIPASWSKKKRVAALAGQVFATVKPDVDNVEKAIADGLNGVVWRDDVQVVRVNKQKRYAATPGVHVRITELEGQCA